MTEGHYEQVGAFIGALVDKGIPVSNGNPHEAVAVVRALFPHGIKPEQYDDLLAMIRMIDSMFLISREKKSAGKTSHYMDIVCWGIRKCQDLNVGFRKNEESGS